MHQRQKRSVSPTLQLSSQTQIPHLQSSKSKNSWTRACSHALHVDTLGIYEKIEPKIGNIGCKATQGVSHTNNCCCWSWTKKKFAARMMLPLQEAGYSTPGWISFEDRISRIEE